MSDTPPQPDQHGEGAFLSVEAAAQDLAESLSRLDDESDRYSKAADTFSKATAATTDLVVAVRDVGEQARRALEVVASVGGPAILKRMDETDRVVASSASKIEAMRTVTQRLFYLTGAAVVLLLAVLVVTLVR